MEDKEVEESCEFIESSYSPILPGGLNCLAELCGTKLADGALYVPRPKNGCTCN
jgi:hypothetical protein